MIPVREPPAITVAPSSTAAPSQWVSLRTAFRLPTTAGGLLLCLALGWLCYWILTLLVFPPETLWGLVLKRIAFVTGTAEALRQAWKLIRAQHKVLAMKEAPALWGLVRFVAWDPNEGVLFLKKKRKGYFDDRLDDGCGGVRVIYPVLGDELALRVPLEHQTFRFSDEKVMTREYLSVMVKGSVKWRINDIWQFYNSVSRELRMTHEHDDHAHHRRQVAARTAEKPDEFESAKERREQLLLQPKPEDCETPVQRREKLMLQATEWLRMLAEEQTRTVMSRLSSGLLLAERLSTEMPEMQAAAGGLPGGGLPATRQGVATAAAPMASAEWNGGTDALRHHILREMAARVAPYGIVVEEVSLQEVRLPEEIVQQCIKACKAAYLPLIAQRKASKRHAELAAEVDVLGKETVGTREVVDAAPAFALVDFVGQFLNKAMAHPDGVGLSAPVAGALAAAPLVAVGMKQVSQ